MTVRIVVLLLTLVLAALTQSPDVSAQTGSKVYRLGWMDPGQVSTGAVFYEAFKTRLAERGYVEGKNLMFEPRWIEGDYQRIPAFVAELERSGVDVIVTPGTKNARLSQELVKRIHHASYFFPISRTTDPASHGLRTPRRGSESS